MRAFEFADKTNDLDLLQQVISQGESAWSEPLTLDQLLASLRNEKPKIKEAEQMPSVVFRKSKEFGQTLQKHSGLLDRVEAFCKTKAENFAALFGAKDEGFVGNAPIAEAVPGLRKAHLTQDVSIVYKIHGKDPRYCDLYGLFSHNELGTGNTGKVKIQKAAAQRFKQAEFK